MGSLETIAENVSSAINLIDFTRKEIARLEGQIDTAKAEEKKLEAGINLDAKAYEVLTIIFDKLNDKGLAALCRLIEGALTRIFTDKEYAVTHDVKVERGANQLRFYLHEQKEHGPVVANMKDAVGGGVRAVAGLICINYYLLKSGAKRLVIMDEALSQIADKYVDSLFELLRSFGNQAGFVYIMVTHDARFYPYFDREYKMKNGQVKLRKRNGD